MPGIIVDIAHAGSNSEVVIIAVHGYIDSTTTPELSMIIDHQIADGKHMLVVNLKGVDYISSIGWGVFISNLKELREHGGDLLLTNMSPNVHNIFDLMELSAIVKSFNEVNKAIVHFLGSEQGTTIKTKAVGAENSAAASKAAYTTTKPTKQAQPIQQPPKETSKKSTVKPIRIHEGRTAKKPPPIELVSENNNDFDIREAHYRQDRLLEKHIVRVVLDKPFLSTGKITKALRLPKYGSVKLSKRKIKHELIKLGLESREDRYEFALRNRR